MNNCLEKFFAINMARPEARPTKIFHELWAGPKAHELLSREVDKDFLSYGSDH